MINHNQPTNMKALILLSIATVAVFTLSACSTDDDMRTTTTTTEEVSHRPVVGVGATTETRTIQSY